MSKGSKKKQTGLVVVTEKDIPTSAFDTGKHPGGRPTKYDPKYCQELIDFFTVPYISEVQIPRTAKDGTVYNEKKVLPTPPPQLAQFAHRIEVCRDTLYEWGEKHPEFSYALSRAKQLAEAMTVSNAMMGFYNPVFTQLVMKNQFGWKDKNELSTDPKSPIQFVIQKEDEDL